MNVLTPQFASSSVTIAAEGLPMPVEVTQTVLISVSHLYMTESRCSVTFSEGANLFAIAKARSGGPGKKASSAFICSMWLCTFEISFHQFLGRRSSSFCSYIFMNFWKESRSCSFNFDL